MSLQLLDNVDDYVNNLKALDSTMREGFSKLSETRFLSNIDCSSSYYDMRMKSLVELEITKGKLILKRNNGSNPILWYGHLSPPSLKEAQSAFINAIEMALDTLHSKAVVMATL